MSIYFVNHNMSDAFKVNSGMGTLALDVPFTPDYIKVDFHGAELSKKIDGMEGDDQVFWDLNYVSPNNYQLVIGWSVYSTREIYYRVSRLTVDPV